MSFLTMSRPTVDVCKPKSNVHLCMSIQVDSEGNVLNISQVQCLISWFRCQVRYTGTALLIVLAVINYSRICTVSLYNINSIQMHFQPSVSCCWLHYTQVCVYWKPCLSLYTQVHWANISCSQADISPMTLDLLFMICIITVEEIHYDYYLNKMSNIRYIVDLSVNLCFTSTHPEMYPVLQRSSSWCWLQRACAQVCVGQLQPTSAWGPFSSRCFACIPVLFMSRSNMN